MPISLVILISNWRRIAPETRPVEALSAFCAVWWTILLLAPVHLFATNLLFLGLQRNGLEWQLAIVTCLVTIVQLAGWFSGIPVVRFIGLLMGLALWLYIDITVIRSSMFWGFIPINTGAGVYTCMSFLNIWSMKQVGAFLAIDLESWKIRLKRQKIKRERARLFNGDPSKYSKLDSSCNRGWGYRLHHRKV